jgi:hypothetical protein
MLYFVQKKRFSQLEPILLTPGTKIINISAFMFYNLILFCIFKEARGSLVVKVLDYKPEGRGFETPMRWNFKCT